MPTSYDEEVVLVPYDQTWPAAYQREAEPLRSTFGSLDGFVIEHVGSTAVKGMLAKPIIDIVIGVSDLSTVPARDNRIWRDLGYTWGHAGDAPDWLFFIKRSETGVRRFHLHVVPAGGPFLRDIVHFRDVLRADPAEAEAYRRLKIALADAHKSDRIRYLDGKSQFVQRLCERADARTDLRFERSTAEFTASFAEVRRRIRNDRFRLQMPKRVALDDVIDGLDMQADDMTAYLDRDTGTVVMVGDEIVDLSRRDEPDTWADWERELVAVLREVENGSKRYVQLPSKRDVHEWDIVRRFCDTVGDDRAKQLLLRAIRGRGVFRRFKDELDRSGLLDRWFDFKRNALREIAIEWCMENAIPF